MAKSKYTLALSLSEEVINALNEKAARTGVSKSAWAEQALRSVLLGVEAAGVVRGDKVKTGSEISKQGEVGAKISNTLDRKLMEMVERKPELLENLDDKTLAQLLVARAPKPRDGDIELELSYLSLTESLKRLPEVEDLSGELKKSKLRIEALLCELESMREWVDALGKRGWREDGFDWHEFRRIMNAWQGKVVELGKKARDAYGGVELPDFHCCLVHGRRFDRMGKQPGDESLRPEEVKV